MERVLELFYDLIRSVSKAQPCLPDIISLMWGLDDLLDDVSKANSQFGDVDDDIQEVFKTGIAQCDAYISLVTENVMYFAASVLDPYIKCTLIKEQYSDEADEIIAKVRAYLKKEYQKQVAP